MHLKQCISVFSNLTIRPTTCAVWLKRGLGELLAWYWSRLKPSGLCPRMVPTFTSWYYLLETQHNCFVSVNGPYQGRIAKLCDKVGNTASYFAGSSLKPWPLERLHGLWIFVVFLSKYWDSNLNQAMPSSFQTLSNSVFTTNLAFDSV